MVNVATANDLRLKDVKNSTEVLDEVFFKRSVSDVAFAIFESVAKGFSKKLTVFTYVEVCAMPASGSVLKVS